MHYFLSKGTVSRLSAWITLQALVAVQILPPFAYAQPKEISKGENLRASLEGSAQSGLEEALTAPTVVSRVSGKGVQVARRSVGTVVGSGGWNPTAASVAEEVTVSSGESAELRRSVKRFLKPGAEFLRRKAAEPVVQAVLGAAKQKSLPVVFFSNSTSLLDWRVTDEQEGRIGVDVSVPEELYQPEYAQGLAVLGGLLLHHAAARAAGNSPRPAYHATIDFYQSLSDDERKQLDELLDTPWIDHGNTFRTFLHRASDSKESPTLQERDRQVSWLLGQIRIDLPYDRAAFGKAARDPDLTLDQRRVEAAKVIAGYDREVEQENARRVAASVRESLPDGYPSALLVAGRLSRAFSNQANLFADSSYVPKTEKIVQAVAELDRAIRDEVQIQVGSLPGTLATQLVRLRPSVAKLRLLAFGPEPAAPMTQYRGAVRQTREALSIVRNRMGSAIQRWRDQQLNAAREGVDRRADAATAAEILNKAAKFQSAFNELAGENGRIDRAIARLEGELAQAQALPAAFSVLLQRPSATGSINLYDVNELEPKPEQEEDLQKLVRLGGHNTYGSPDLAWVAEATDVIEAAPLSIYERLVEVDGRNITVFEVDQEALEQTIRQMADPWARNIEQTIDSEHAVLARRVMVESDPALAEKARQYQERGATEEGAILRVVREAAESVQQQTARVAAWVAREFERRVEQVEAMVESRWKEKEFIDRLEALQRVLPKPAEIVRSVRQSGKALDAQAQRLLPAVLSPRRERPAFHMLTTEAPGLVEGFIQVVLEEEMALRNVLAGEGKRRGKDYEAEVQERIKEYRARISALAERVVEQFGYGVMVEHLERQGQSRDKALQKVIGDNLILREELAYLAVLAEAQEAQQKAKRRKYTFDAAHLDHPLVETILQSDQAADLRKRAEQETAENNRFDPVLKNLSGDLSQAIEGSELLRKERDQRLRSLARREALADLSRQNPGWQLESRAHSWWRQHTDTGLAQTTARREVVAAHGLHARMMDPRTYYGSGAVYQRSDGRFAASGRRKRYDLIYAPSRVNLARGERESVEVYPQWVGVTDPLSARRAHRVYSLINENVQVRLIQEAETLKVSENERTALVRAVANTQAFFTQSLGVGDPEDLSYQFNLRGGLPVAAMKEGESFQAGPTTGYCIPKDPLFKLFRHALTDAGKLTQIGIPAHLQPVLIQMAAEIESRRSDFDSEGEYEQWVMQELLSKEGLRRRFKPADADAVLKSLSPYLSVTGGVLLFHLSKLHEILGNLGRPSLLASRGQDLGLFLWSQWAGKKVTLGGEQVNRATIFQTTSDVFHLREEAARLNPGADVSPENKMLVHGYGPYKGDPDHPSPPDMRDSAAVRVMLDLSDMGEYVVHSLDEEGQAIWRADRYGFQLDSDKPDDLRVTRLLAEEFLGITETDVRSSGWYLNEWRNLQPRAGTRLPQGGIVDPQQFMKAEANLLLQGYAQILRELREKSDPRIEALEASFPGHGTVGDFTLTVVPGVSTQDAMEAKVDARTAMSETADQVQALLTAVGGVSVQQMQANARLRRPLDKWIPLTDLPPDQREKLVTEIGGKIHPLALRLRGPGTEFRQDLQGQDVVIFFTVHPDLLALNPAELRDLMLTGRPNSALGIRDGSAQGRHRVWFDREVMLWYAAGRGVDPQGQIIRDWSRRDAEGRQSVYASFGVGDKSWKPLLGTDLREEVVRQEHRAMALYAALEKVASAPADRLAGAVREAEQVYQRELPHPQMALEAEMAAEYQQMVQSKGVDRPRDEIIRGHLQQLAEELSLREFTPVHWLSTGGNFLLNGAPQEQQTDVLKVLSRAQERIRFSTAVRAAGLEESPRVLIRELIVPQLKPEAMQASELRGREFSVKASEQQLQKAVAKLAALQAEAVRQGALAQREKGFRAVSTLSGQDPLEQSQLRLQEMTGLVRSAGSADGLHQAAGEVLGWTVQALRQVNEEFLSKDPEDAKKKEEAARQISALTDGRELNSRAIRRFTGTYEDPGIFALWFEKAGNAGREKVASAVELFTVSLALEKVTPFLGQPADQVDEPQFWRALADFYAETLDDHYHEYNPWAYDPKRGSGFSDFYDKLGTLKPERAEELYGLAWRHGRALYGFLRKLAASKTSLARLSETDRDLLLSRVELGDSPAQDRVTVQAIGAGASAPEELKWRAYNQLREMAFLRNDGFQWPAVFEQIDPDDPEVLDARHRVNFTFMAPTGRTHYSRALMEGPALGENLFITRNGRMATPAGANSPVLQIDDAQFWMSEAEYRQTLIRSKGMTADAAGQQIEADRKSGRLVPKGIRVAARFQKPVTVGSVVPMHHHPLVPALGQAGYPYTDKSEVHYDITYDKSLYPDIFNPAYRTGVLLPPEIDWHHEETVQTGSREAAVPKIREWLRPFAQEHGTLIVKGSAESGARNFQRFDLLDSQGRIIEERLTAAAEFIYEVSKGQNVTVQKMVLTTPITWMDPAAVQEFVNRQIKDFGVAVNLQTHPKSWVYGSVRVILSSGVPENRKPDESGLFNPANWQVAHRISLTSLQAATNVGRQGTLEVLTPQTVRPEFRDRFIPELEEAGRRVMVALARYGKKYWDEHGMNSAEFDASGVPYWWPRYMMLDIVPEPVWARDGKEVGEARLIDVIPGDPARGTPSRFVLKTPDGQEFDGEILGFKFWLLEPNIGIGLWPNYWRRELVHEEARAKAEGNRPVDWSKVGEADRVVLNDYLLAGEAFLDARFGGDYFDGGPHRRPVTAQSRPAEPEPSAVPEASTDPFQQALSAVRGLGVSSIGPAEVSLVLVEAGLRALGGRAALGAGQEPEKVLQQAVEWLNPERIGAQFPQGAGISVSGIDVARWLNSSAYYRTRIGELILDRVLSEPLAPPVAVLPGRLTREEAEHFLPESSTFAVVTGKRTLMNHHAYPFEVARGGRPVNVVGVNSEWLGSDLRANRLMVLNPGTGNYYVEFGLLEPVPISRAFIVELDSYGEVITHEELTEFLTSHGVQVINPVGEAQQRADDKYWLRKHAVETGIEVPFSVVVPQNVASVEAGQALLDSIAERSPSGVVIQPSAGTTEGAGVRWFSSDDKIGQVDHVGHPAIAKDSLVSSFRANVTVSGRPLVLRVNVSNGHAASASAIVGKAGEKIASLGQGGEVIPLGQALSQLRNPVGEEVPITEQDWERIEAAAESTARAVGLPLVGIDIVLDQAAGVLRPVVIEANARPGLLIFGESVRFPQSEGQEIESRPAAPVGPDFWDWAGMTLQQWTDLLKSGRTDWLDDHYSGDLEAHRARLIDWTNRLLQREVPGRSGIPLFDRHRLMVVTRTPGRFLFPVTGRHLDYLGGLGGSIGSPTEQETVLFAQEVDGLNGNVEIYQVIAPDPSVARSYPDEGQGPRLLSLQDEVVNPDRTITTLAEWDAWAAEVTKIRKQRRTPETKLNHAEDLADASISFARTDFGDPSGRIRRYLDRLAREGKGLRIGIAANLPVGGGLSSSSSVAIGFAQTLAALAGVDLSGDALVNFGYAERFYAGTQGGVKDQAHIVNPPGFLGVEPTRTITTIEPIPGTSALMLDSGISRDTAPAHSPKLSSPRNDEQNIKGRTATGYALVNLWLRHIRPDLNARIAPDAQNPDGYLRNLVPGNPGGMSVREVYQLLHEIPAEGLTRRQMYEQMPEFKTDLDRLFAKREEPPEPYALREMALFFFAEESRNWEVVRTLNALKAEQINLDQAFQRLVEVGRAAHNGDRVTRYQVTAGSGGDSLDVKDIGWNWHLSDQTLDRYIELPNADEAALWRQAGRLERSIEPLDRLVDLVEYFNQLKGGAAVAVVMGAGLGGTVGAFVRDEFVDELTGFLDEHYYKPLGLSHGPAIRATAGKGASVLTAPSAAGLEEPLSFVTGHSFQETGIPGYRRLVHQRADGSSFLGGVVKADVPTDAIDPTAVVAADSYLEGPAVRLQKGAQVGGGSAVIDSVIREEARVSGSTAEKALIHPKAQVSDSALGPAFDKDSWSYSVAMEGNPELSVGNHSVHFGTYTYRTEIEAGARTEGSVLQDSFVGSGSTIRGSALFASRWGSKTHLDGGVKSWLAVAAQGHANVAGIQHRPDGSEVPAALEVAETAYVGLPENQHPGLQVRERRVGYTEVAVGNSIPLAHYDGQKLEIDPTPVPPITLNGDYGIFSIFAGAPNPNSIKTDGRPTPGVVTRLTGGPGEQTSQHGRIVADPLSIVASFSNVIGRLLGFPEWGASAALMNEPEITHLGALSAVGIDTQLGLNGLEAWGQILSGEARGQLGRASGMAPWVFLYAPEVLFSLMGQLGPSYDDLPQKILESGLALSRWMLDQEHAKGDDANAQVIGRLTRYAAGYAALSESGAWAGPWVQEGGLRHPAHWSFRNGRWESESLDLEAMHRTIHPLTVSVPYAQVSLKQLLALPEGVVRPDWSEWTGHYLKAEDLQVDPPTPLDQLEPVDDSLKTLRIIGQDEKYYYTVEGGRIGKEVDLDNIHPSALIGPGTVLNGESTSIGEGSRLLRVVANQSAIGKQAQLTAVRADRTFVGGNVKLTWAKLMDSDIGSGTTGAYVGVARRSTIGENNTFEPFALVINSTTAPGNVIGVSLVNSKVLPGFMGRHLSTAVHGIDQQPVRFTINGTEYNLEAASLNVAGGLFIRGSETNPIRLSAAYPLSLTTIQPGKGLPSEIGAFSVLKNQIVLDGEILPLTFHAFNNLPPSDPRFATPGRHNDALGGALDFPGIFLRNFIYRTKKGIWDDLAAQGLTAEQIAAHPRLLQADYMVEATIVQALEQVLSQLKEVDPAAYNRLSGEDRQSLGLKQLIQYLKQDLSQIEQTDQAALGVRPQEIRGGVRGMIQEVDRVLQNLLGERPSEVSFSGHSSAQLLDGIGRLARNLDGRWRMRNHTFTDVEWRYVAREGERALDTWKPVFKEEIILPPKAARSVVVLTPKTAVREIHTLEQLANIGGYLEIPPASDQLWKTRLEELQLSPAA